MSTEEQKFDELIRSKFNEQEFPFDEENWDRAEEMIAVGRKKKIFLRFGTIFLSGLAAGILLMLPFISFNNNDQNTVQISENGIKTTEKSAPSSASETNKNNELIAENKSIPDKQIQNGNTNDPEEIASEEEKQKTLIPPVYSNVLPVEKAGPPSSVPATFISSENIPAVKEKKEPFVQNEQTAGTYFNAEEFKPELNLQKEVEISLSKTENTSTETPGAVSVSVQPSQDSVKTILAVPVLAEQQTIHLINSDSAKEKPLTTETLATNEVLQSKPVPQQGTDIFQNNIFSFIIGGHYNLGWSYQDSSEAKGFNPVIGFGINHYLNKKISFSSGLLYESIAHLSLSSITIADVKSDFGFSSSNTVIDTRWLHYLSAPLLAQYHFNQKNSVLLGGNFSYLLNTSSKLITYDQSYFETSNRKELNSFGYMKGFNAWNLELSAAYSRRFTDNVSVIAGLHYGMSDIKDNDFFGRNYFERTMRAEILITYDFIQKQK